MTLLGVSREKSTYVILDAIAEAGWSVAIVKGERGLKVTARRGVTAIDVDGKGLSEIALVLYEACVCKEGAILITDIVSASEPFPGGASMSLDAEADTSELSSAEGSSWPERGDEH